MANKSTIGSVLLDAGIIVISGKRCVCNCCKATGRAETLEIKHKKECTASTAVRNLIETLHDDDKFTPQVEKPIELDMMLPYYAELTKEEYTVADAVATAIFASATPQEREKFKKKIMEFEPTCEERPDLIATVMKKGLETNTDRINFRNWLVFKKVSEREMAKIEARHYELECEATQMQELFDHALRVE